MPDRDEGEWESEHRARLRRGERLFAASLTASARVLEAEQDRWFLWLPVLFAGDIITYFALADEPAAKLAAALVLGALGLCLVLITCTARIVPRRRAAGLRLGLRRRQAPHRDGARARAGA